MPGAVPEARRAEVANAIAKELVASGTATGTYTPVDGKLDVPVAEFVPEELVQVMRHIAEAVFLDARGHGADELGQMREHPGI